MAKRGHTEEQILRALHQAEGGTMISDLCREHGISEATYYVWKKKYAGLGLSALRDQVAARRWHVRDAAG
jgi:putative transposase